MTGLVIILVAGNLLAWCWALAVFHGSSVLLATAGLAYGFGLRHGFDADHIAAIDNVMRKLVHHGERPVYAGLFFALGHSSLVVVAATAIALSAGGLLSAAPQLIGLSGAIGTAFSASLLLAIGIMNIAVFGGVLQAFRRVRRGEPHDEESLAYWLSRRGLLARLFRRTFALVTRSWHMYPIGLLFAFSFDTATEIGILGISASQAVQGLSLGAILAFPVLFAAGMMLIDGCDGMLMLEAYDCAFPNPLRRLYYNLAITGVSIVLALAVGSVEAIGLAAQHFGLEGGAWGAVAVAANQTGTLGYLAFGAVAAIWLGRLVMRRTARSR